MEGTEPTAASRSSWPTIRSFSQDPSALAPHPGAGDGDVTRVGAAAIGMGKTNYIYIYSPASGAKDQKAPAGARYTAGYRPPTSPRHLRVTDFYLNKYADSNEVIVLHS